MGLSINTSILPDNPAIIAMPGVSLARMIALVLFESDK